MLQNLNSHYYGEMTWQVVLNGSKLKVTALQTFTTIISSDERDSTENPTFRRLLLSASSGENLKHSKTQEEPIHSERTMCNN